MQDVIQLNSTIDHKFATNLNLRNQTEFVWVNTACARPRAASSARSPRTAASCRRPPVRATRRTAPRRSTSSTSASSAAIETSTTITLENQTEVTAKFDTAFVGHTLLMGLDLNYESLHQQDLYPHRHLQRHPAGGGLSRLRGRGLHDRRQHAVQRSQPAGQLCVVAGLGLRHVCQRHHPGAARGSSSSAACAGTSIRRRSATRSIRSTRPATRRRHTRRRPTTSPAFAPARSSSRRGSSPTTSPTARRSIRRSSSSPSTTGTTSRCRRRTNEAFEAGAKYELLNGNLSLNGALFQITKNNARTANADGTFTADRARSACKGARAGVAGQITPDWQVFGGYTYLDGRIITDWHRRRRRHHRQRAAQHAARLRPTSGRPTPSTRPTRSAAASTYVGQRYANNTEHGAGAGATPASTLTAAYKQPRYDVRFNVFNLFNTMYYDQLMASDGGRAVPGSGLTGHAHADLPHVTEAAATMLVCIPNVLDAAQLVSVRERLDRANALGRRARDRRLPGRAGQVQPADRRALRRGARLPAHHRARRSSATRSSSAPSCPTRSIRRCSTATAKA